MNKLIKFLLIFICTSCASVEPTATKENQMSKIIPYVLPSNVEDLILSNILVRQNKDVCLDLRNMQDDYVIYISEVKNIITQKTNRKVIIGQSSIPLVLEYDYNFASFENADSLIQRINYSKEEFPIRRTTSYPSYHNVYHIIFKINGDILYSGY